MTQAVQQLLATFASLSEDEQRIAAIEVMRRAPEGPPELPEETLAEIADARFVETDRREAGTIVIHTGCGTAASAGCS